MTKSTRNPITISNPAAGLASEAISSLREANSAFYLLWEHAELGGTKDLCRPVYKSFALSTIDKVNELIKLYERIFGEPYGRD